MDGDSVAWKTDVESMNTWIYTVAVLLLLKKAEQPVGVLYPRGIKR